MTTTATPYQHLESRPGSDQRVNSPAGYGTPRNHRPVQREVNPRAASGGPDGL